MRATSLTRSVVAWALTPFFLMLVGAGVTRTPLLWARTSFEDDAGPRMVFSQTYQAMRQIYAGPPCDGPRIVLLGNSRLWMVRAQKLKQRLGEAGSGPACVKNLAVFGIGPPGIQAVARHASRQEMTLAVIAVSGSDLWIPLEEDAQRTVLDLLPIGWDPKQPPSLDNLEAALRAAWPLYRFKEFARAALIDRIHPAGNGRRMPDRFSTTHELFEYMQPGTEDRMEAAYRSFLRDPSLESFVGYLRVGQHSHVNFVRRRQQNRPEPGVAEANARILEDLLESLRDRDVPAVLLLMPVNPILRMDEAQTYHDPVRSRRGAELVTEVGKRLDVPVLDARDWLPLEAFLDFDHVLIDLSGFEARLARELGHEL